MLTIDGVTSFLQLLDGQNVCKNTRFSLNKSFWQCVQDGGIVIDYEVFIFLYVRIELNLLRQLCMAKYITVCRSVVSG